MKKHKIDNSDALELRKKAEAELKVRKPLKSDLIIDNLKLIHELQVHQIELEMQNDELILAKEKAEIAMEKYTNLYDFAPSGYLSISEEGDIVSLNFAAAKLLGKDRIYLKNSRFGLYVHPSSIGIYNKSLHDAFFTKSKKTCELFLVSNSEKSIFVHIVAFVPESGKECLLTMIDISERKRLEDELESALTHYKALNAYFLDREIRMMDLKKEINELLIKGGCEQKYLIM